MSFCPLDIFVLWALIDFQSHGLTKHTLRNKYAYTLNAYRTSQFETGQPLEEASVAAAPVHPSCRRMDKSTQIIYIVNPTRPLYL
jgi:hypothetical protein